VPLGVTFSFLVSAPMVNEIAVVLLYGLLGWKVAALYMVTGLGVAVLSGWVIGRLKLERHVEDWVYQLKVMQGAVAVPEPTLRDRIEAGRASVIDVVGRVWPFGLAGIGGGAVIHGYVPEGLMASFMGRDAWWAVPLAVALGVPMYSNAAGIIPIVHALLEKGAALGTALAFMMAVIGLSLPETIILRKVLKLRLIAVFICVVAAGIMCSITCSRCQASGVRRCPPPAVLPFKHENGMTPLSRMQVNN
jgi:uncharacterized membrane protein YraQ (UPF0718 family)